MGLLGKILAIFNVLAAIGFLVLAVMDYGKQRAWSTAIFQEDLLRDGLPVDDTEKDFDGEIISKKIGAYTLQQLLTGGKPVTTQLEEVNQRQSALNDSIAQAGDEATQRKKMAEILLPLATSFGEREAMKNHIATDPLDQLLGDEGPFKTAFREAREGKVAPKITAPGTDSVSTRGIGKGLRREAIAHLLFNLGDKPDNYDQRLQGVIGQKAFVGELANQSAVNRQLLDEYETAIRLESKPFESQHHELLSQIVASAQHLQEQRDEAQKQETIRDSHKAMIGRRQEIIADMQARVGAAQKQLDATLARQKELETALDKANSDAARVSEATKTLEKEIRSRELGR
jgi:hypothetical protein